MAEGTILLVEDDDSVRRLLCQYLAQRSALEIDDARDGADALHQVARKHYNVVILDLMMPHMTGIDFLDSLAALSSDPSVKHLDDLPAVVVITSASPEQVPSTDIEQRFPNMVRAVLRKPLDVEQLAERVEELL